MIFSLPLFLSLHAQNYWSLQSGTSNNIYYSPSSGLGNVGIGELAPTTKLHVVDNGYGSTVTIQNTSSAAQAAILFKPSGNNFTLGASGSSNTTLANNFYLYNNTTSSFPFVIKGSNNYFGIGTINPQALLAVKGTIFCTRLKVTPTSNTTDWPDYVFADDYKLVSLNSVESYVKTNKHLLNIPSAQEVVDNGLDVGDAQKAMLQKIEELTLYIIQQQKELKVLTNKVTALEEARKTTEQ